MTEKISNLVLGVEKWGILFFFAHRIRISEILPWDRKSYLSHAILLRTSSNVIMCNCILDFLKLI